VNSRPTSDSVPPRQGSGQLAAGWGDKEAETLRRKRAFYHRTWFRRIALGLLVVTGLAGAIGLWKLDTWHAERRATVEAERSHLAAFVASDEFAQFARAADAQLVAVLNFASARPDSAAAALPAVAAWEKAHGELPWALQLRQLPVSAASRPDRVAAAGRDAARLLARHSFVWDEPTRLAGRKVFLRLLSPYAGAFVRRAPESSLRIFWTEPSLQDEALAAFGARSGSPTPRADAERLFAFYALVGPAMWSEIEQSTLTATPAR
jgi:hypothetical protein